MSLTDSYSMSTVPSVQCRTFETDRPMSISELQYLVVDALEDVKAQDIRVFDTRPPRPPHSPPLPALLGRGGGAPPPPHPPDPRTGRARAGPGPRGRLSGGVGGG